MLQIVYTLESSSVQILRHKPRKSQAYLVYQSNLLRNEQVLFNDNLLGKLLEKIFTKLTITGLKELNLLGIFYAKLKFKHYRRQSRVKIFVPFGTDWFYLRKALPDDSRIYVQFLGIDASLFLPYRDYQKALIATRATLVVLTEHMRIDMLKVLPDLKGRLIKKCLYIPKVDVIENIKSRSFRFGFIGRLTGKKNPLALLESIRLFIKDNPDANVEFHIIGDGELEEEVESFILKHSLKICRKTRIDHKDLFPFLFSLDVYIQHSSEYNGDKEGWPVIIAQAALSGLPVVSTRHAGIPEQVIDGVTGFLVRENDSIGFAKAMHKLYKNRDLRKVMGSRAKSYMEQTIDKNSVKTLI